MVSPQESASIAISTCLLTYWLILGAFYFYQSTRYDASRELIEACVIQLKRGANKQPTNSWLARLKFFQIWLIFLQYVGLLWRLVENERSTDALLKWFVVITTLNSMEEGFLIYISLYFAVYFIFFLWYAWLQYKTAYRIGPTTDWRTYILQVVFLQWGFIPSITCFISVSGCQWDGESRKLDAGQSRLECFQDGGSIFAVVVAAIFFCFLYTASLENRLKEDKWYMTYIIQPRYTVVQTIISTFLVCVLVSFSSLPVTACALVTVSFLLMGGFCLWTQPALGSGREVNHHLVSSLFGIFWIGLFFMIYLIADFEPWIMYVIIGSTTPLVIALAFLASRLWLARKDQHQIRQCGTLVKFHAKATEATLEAARSFAVLSLIDEYRETLCTTVATECIPLYKNFIVGNQIEQLDIDVLSWLTRGLANIASSSSEARQKLIDVDIMPYLFRFLNARASESVKRTGIDKAAITVICNLAVEKQFGTWILANQKHLRTLVDRVQPATSSILKSGIHDQEVRAFAANTVLNVLKQNTSNKKISRAFSAPRTLKKLRGLLKVQEWEIRIRGLHIFYYLALVKENAPKITSLLEFVSMVGDLALNDPISDIRDSAICVLQKLSKHSPGIFSDYKQLQSTNVTLPDLEYYALDLNFEDISTTLTLHKNSANNLDEYTALPEDDINMRVSPTNRDASKSSANRAQVGKAELYEIYRERLVKIYTKHNPKKIALIDGWLDRNVHDLQSLYEKICEKYNLVPEPQPDVQTDSTLAASYRSNLSDTSSHTSGGSFLSWPKSPTAQSSSFMKRTTAKKQNVVRRTFFQSTPTT